MLCPICNSPIINPMWKTCHKRPCYEKYSKTHGMVRRGPKHKRRNLTVKERDMLSLLLWQGQSKEFMCRYLHITLDELNYALGR